MKVYLDNAATTPMAPEIIELMSEMMKATFGNPSSVHELGRKSKIIIETSRKTIATLLNASPKTIFFTSGGTEADNMAIKCGIMIITLHMLLLQSFRIMQFCILWRI